MSIKIINTAVNLIFKYLDINTNTISNVVYSSKLVTNIQIPICQVKLFLYFKQIKAI